MGVLYLFAPPAFEVSRSLHKGTQQVLESAGGTDLGNLSPLLPTVIKGSVH